jgi:hypothetical protein
MKPDAKSVCELLTQYLFIKRHNFTLSLPPPRAMNILIKIHDPGSKRDQ